MTAIPMPDHDHVHDQEDHDHEHEHEHHDHEHPHSRQETLQLWLKAALLLGMGLYFVYNIASGNILNYINVRFAWLSYVAAVLFLVLGVFSVWHLVRDHGEQAHAHDHGDHVHTPISWKALALLAVPLFLGVLIPSRPLGAEAVSGGVSLTSSATIGNNSQSFNVPPLQRNVLDWLRAFNSGSYTQFNGQQADVIGFVYTEPTFDKNEFMVARFAITCCVADATAIGVPAYWAKASDLAQGQWVEVKGAFNVAAFKGDQVPVLQATSIDKVEQPAHPYLYP